jgi:hypothetical protein
MANNLKYSVALKNAQQDAITTNAGASPVISIYSGTQPTNPDTSIGAAVELAALPCSATMAAAAAAGVLTLNAITSGTGTAGASTGTTATWFRLWKAGKTVGVMDGTVGITGCDLNINNTSIATGQTVSISSYTVTNAQ